MTAPLPPHGPGRADWIAARNREARDASLALHHSAECDPLHATESLSEYLRRELRKNCDPRDELEWGRALTIAAAEMAGVLLRIKARPGYQGQDMGPIVLNIIGWAAADLVPDPIPPRSPATGTADAATPPAEAVPPVGRPWHRTPAEATAAAAALMGLLHEIDDPEVCDLIATRAMQWEAEAAHLRSIEASS